MAKSSRYRLKLRRRRQRKTDYQARKAFVVSGKPRLVARSSLNNTIAQIIVAKPHGDEVLASAHSRELVKKYGWKAATGNIPAAYLTGLLCGLKAKANGVSEAILDLGLVAPTKGSKAFSVLRGVVDAGVEVPHDEEKIVEEHLRGEHIVQYAENLGSAEEYAPKFSGYFANKLPPAKLTEHIEKVKANILGAFSEGAKPEAKKPQEPEKAEAKTAEAKPAKAAAKPAKAEAKKAEGKAAAKASGKSKAPAKAAAKAKTKKPAKAAKPAKSAKTKRKKA